MSGKNRILLKAPKYCGRGVEYHVLTVPEKDAARERAAKLSPPPPPVRKAEDRDEAASMAFQSQNLKECILAMIDRVTKADGLRTPAELLAKSSDEDWQKMDSSQYEEIFCGNSCNHEFLSNVFIKLHQVSEDEVDAALGEAFAVA